MEPNGHCSVHNSPPLVSILNQINPVHTPSYPLKINSNIILHLHVGFPSCLFPSVFPTNTLHAPLTSPAELFLHRPSEFYYAW